MKQSPKVWLVTVTASYKPYPKQEDPIRISAGNAGLAAKRALEVLRRGPLNKVNILAKGDTVLFKVQYLPVPKGRPTEEKTDN